MKLLIKVLLVVIIVAVVAGIGAYAAYNYINNNSNPSPTPTPTPTASPTASPSPTSTPTSSASPSPTASPSPSPSPTASPSPTPTPSPVTLTVATTTSLYQSGLEDTPEILSNGTVIRDDIKDTFQAAYPWITINFDPLGTGLAIAKAQSGTDDMLLVHSPSQELTFMNNGYGVDRKLVAYNFFIIVGPPSDPAHIAGMTNVNQALIAIYQAAQNNSANPANQQVLWFSRNDISGTNTKEISLWNAALTGTGVTYNQLNNTALNGSWFKDTNTGMGPTLLAATYYGAVGGYTISDTGTYYAYYDRGDINLQIVVGAQQSLLNVYSAIIDNPQNAALANTKFNASLTFVSWLVSNAGQQVIANYGKAVYNQQLFNAFVPLATNQASNSTLWSWITSYAYMYYNTTSSKLVISASGSECPSQYQYNAGTLYQTTFDTVNIPLDLSNYAVTDTPKLLYTPPAKTTGKQTITL